MLVAQPFERPVGFRVCRLCLLRERIYENQLFRHPHVVGVRNAAGITACSSFSHSGSLVPSGVVNSQWNATQNAVGSNVVHYAYVVNYESNNVSAYSVKAVGL